MLFLWISQLPRKLILENLIIVHKCNDNLVDPRNLICEMVQRRSTSKIFALEIFPLYRRRPCFKSQRVSIRNVAIINVWWFNNDHCVCVIVTNSTPPTSKCSSGDLLPHGDPDMIGSFRVAHRCVAGMESRYRLVFTKSSLSPVTGSPQKT